MNEEINELINERTNEKRMNERMNERKMTEQTHNQSNKRTNEQANGCFFCLPGAFSIFESLKFYSSSTSYVEYQAGGGKGLVDLVNQLTLERCHSF